MKQLLNTLYVTSPEAYLSRDGMNVVIAIKGEIAGRVPIHNLESIVMFGRMGASSSLMELCVDNQVSLFFMTPFGRVMAHVIGVTRGNVLLRREQYRIADDSSRSLNIARNMILGKIANYRAFLRKYRSNYKNEPATVCISDCIDKLTASLIKLNEVNSLDFLRGLEGSAANCYFDIFDNLIRSDKESFVFKTRNRRPPRDRVNAMLSFLYSVLSNDVVAALESVGLDPYVGFLHTDRPGRPSLALDLMEELRPIVDRTVIYAINLRIIDPDDFIYTDDGAVMLNDESRKSLIDLWQSRKNMEIYHPYLNESISQGLLPYVQSMLLAKYIRKEIDGYPPFIMREKKC